MIKFEAYVKITQRAYIHDKYTEAEKEDIIERMKQHIWNVIKTITRENIDPVITIEKAII